MGKGRPDMMDIDRVTKKKVSEDKVTKHEGKHRKPSRQFRLEDSDDESSKASIDQEGGASLFQGDEDRSHIEYLESREAKIQRKRDDHLREEALKRFMEEDLNPSDLHVATQAERQKKKKNEKRNAKRALERQTARQGAIDALSGLTPTDGDDTSMVDVKPTLANVETLKPDPSEDEDMEDGGAPLSKKEPGYTAPPSGVNRANRRRFMLIEREKRKIKTALGVSEDSNEKPAEVKRLLDEFTERLDAQTAERDTRKKDRKMREAARLCDKRSRVLERTSMKERREKAKMSRDN